MLWVLVPIFLFILFLINRAFLKLDREIEGSDGGYTSLLYGNLRRKDEPIFHALGDIDELNSHLGFTRHQFLHNIMDIQRIETIQKKLMDISSVLAGFNITHFDIDIECFVSQMEMWIEQDPIRVTSFIIPSHYLHICRTVCRRAERSVVSLGGRKSISKFLNRLSKYLYALALKEHHIADTVSE